MVNGLALTLKNEKNKCLISCSLFLMRYMKKVKRQTIFSSWFSRLLLAKSTCIWVNLPAVFQPRLASGTIAPFL